MSEQHQSLLAYLDARIATIRKVMDEDPYSGGTEADELIRVKQKVLEMREKIEAEFQKNECAELCTYENGQEMAYDKVLKLIGESAKQE